MRLEIEIPEHHYNNIMALDSVSLGRVPYKGIIMYTINAIKHGKVLEQEPKSEWEHDHEILKAYSNGANEVLDKIRAEIENIDLLAEYTRGDIKRMAFEIIDKYKAETEDT